jgi:hypothetical protein
MISFRSSVRPIILGCLAASVIAVVGSPVASADTPLPQAGSTSADLTISAFQNAGYDVQINWVQGHPNVPLNECKVNDIHNPNGAMASIMMLSTVYLDVTCPNAK